MAKRKDDKLLQDAGYDMLNCDNGTYDAWYWAHPPAYMPQNCNLQDVAEIKKYVDIPVVCAGRMEPDVGAKAVEEGKIDAMGVARQFLADPEWVTKLMNDDLKAIRPCICCHNACFNMAHYKGVANDQTLSDNAGMARCALNPETMQSKKYKIVPAKTSKKIAIIGGGIGGLESARVLALRGHKPTIFEKSDVLGGAFIPAAAPYFKEKDRDLIEWYKKEMADLGVEIKYNTEVKSLDDIKDYDDYIVATGATARKIRTPGVENTVEAIEYLLGKKPVGDNVVIIGGGLTGCEIAYDLYHKGKKPTIVEMKDDLIAIRGVCLANSSYLRDFFEANKVPVYLNAKVEKINPDSVEIVEKSGAKLTLSCDSSILSVGYVSKPTIDGKHNLVGDCNKVGNLRTVIWKAWDVAMKI